MDRFKFEKLEVVNLPKCQARRGLPVFSHLFRLSLGVMSGGDVWRQLL
jgi:hypothetical protein